MAAEFKTSVLGIATPAQFAEAVRQAAAVLRAGGLVALPTETVYGLAANALDAAAVQKIFAAKGRPSHNPIIVHVASAEMARACVGAWTKPAEDCARSFWPGPLTVVLPRAPQIPEVVTAGGATVGIRWPEHPLMQAVIRECGFPLAAPSANRSNQLSPTTAEHVHKDLGGKIPLIIDGGPSRVGIESTVIDLTAPPYRVLRAGMIHEESLRAVLGKAAVSAGHPAPAGPGPLRSPGLLSKHYSPRAKLLVLSWEDDAGLRAQLAGQGLPAAQTWVVAHQRVPRESGLAGVCVMPHDAKAYARALYAELHRGDEAAPVAIVVEAPPDLPEWQGIRDRLARAGGV